MIGNVMIHEMKHIRITTGSENFNKKVPTLSIICLLKIKYLLNCFIKKMYYVLQRLAFLQKRAQVNKKTKNKKRYVLGWKEILQCIKLNQIFCVLISKDINPPFFNRIKIKIPTEMIKSLNLSGRQIARALSLGTPQNLVGILSKSEFIAAEIFLTKNI